MHHRGGRGLPVAFAATLLLVWLTACGSTVAGSASGPPGSRAASDLAGGVAPPSAISGTAQSDASTETPGVESTAGPSSLAGGPSGVAGATSSSPSRGGSSASGSTSGGQPSPGAAGTGPGVTGTTVALGFAKTDDAGEYLKALGFEGFDAGDVDAQVRAVVEDIHRRGGLAGREIVLVTHNFRTAEVVNNPNAAYQAACATWTEDHQVFAVLGAGHEVLLACLQKHDTPLIGSGGVEYPRAYGDTYVRYPNFFHVGGMVGERLDRITARRLVARNFFESWDAFNGGPGSAPMRLGLLGTDSPWGETRIRSTQRELARHGIEPTAVVRCSEAISSLASCHQNAVLRFRSEGVTHVMGAGLGLFFIGSAESQHYRPRYVIETGTSGIIAQNAPPEQLNGSMSQSFIPAMDVNQSEDPGDPTPAATYCKRVMEDAGQTYSDRSTLWAMQAICDAFFFVKSAVDSNPVLTTDGLRDGFEGLGSRVPSALTWSTYFGPGEHASTMALRDLSYQTECTCFFYTSNENHGDA